jgi:uncharacterized protein (DUF1697 family)
MFSAVISEFMTAAVSRTARAYPAVVATHAAFLRAVNLGAARQVRSKELCACLESAGFAEVSSFRTSGNVVFGAKGSAGELARRVEKALAAEFGFEVPVYLRTGAQVRRIAAREPFQKRAVEASKGKLQVALLPAKPGPRAVKAVLALASGEDRLAVEGTELYWLPSGGTQQSALDMKAIDRAIGPYTMRTMGTIEKLAEKFFA